MPKKEIINFKARSFYSRRKRKVGKSKFSLTSYFSLATIGIISFSKKPLVLIFFNGLIFFGISVLMLIYYLFQYFVGKIEVAGFTTLIVILLGFFGLSFLYLGIMALYLSQIHDDVKKRPIYIKQEEQKNEKQD